MPADLEDWTRKHYTPGGGEPFLFYVLFGKPTAGNSLSASKYRCSEMPAGIKVMRYGPEQHPEAVSSFQEGYLWEQLQQNEPELAEQIEQCDSCTVLRGSPEDDSNLNYLRNTIGLITYFLDEGCCAVYDPQMFQWWHPKEWKERIFEPAKPVPRSHAVTLFSPEEHANDRTWYHTRGMRKFGRPDISVHNVPSDQKKAVVEMIQRLIEHQAFGLVVPEGKAIRMEALPSGGIAHHGGDVEDPDFNNVHIEVVWDEWK